MAFVCLHCNEDDDKRYQVDEYKMCQHLSSKRDDKHMLAWEDVRLGVDYYKKPGHTANFSIGSDDGKGAKMKPGDWKCSKCGYHCSASKAKCPKCEERDGRVGRDGGGEYEVVDDDGPALDRELPSYGKFARSKGKGKEGKGKDKGKVKGKGKGRKSSPQGDITANTPVEEVWLIIGRHGEEMVASSLSSLALCQEMYRRMSAADEGEGQYPY